MTDEARTSWQRQRDELQDDVSLKFAGAAKRDFVKFRRTLLDRVAGELLTRRQAMDAFRRKVERIRAQYLRFEGTMYAGWLKHGPQPEWDELVEAARDDAVWDRLVERVTQETQR